MRNFIFVAIVGGGLAVVLALGVAVFVLANGSILNSIVVVSSAMSSLVSAMFNYVLLSCVDLVTIDWFFENYFVFGYGLVIRIDAWKTFFVNYSKFVAKLV